MKNSKKPSHRRKYPEGEIKRLIDEFSYDDNDLALHFGVKRGAARRARLRAGVHLGAPRGVASIDRPGVRSKIESLLDDGYSYNAIFEMTGVHRSEISKAYPGRGFTMEQRVEAMGMARSANETYRKLGAA